MWRQVSLGCLAVVGVSCASASSTVPPPAAPTVALTTATAELPPSSQLDLPPHVSSTDARSTETNVSTDTESATMAPAEVTDLAGAAAIDFITHAVANDSQTVDAIGVRTEQNTASTVITVVTLEIADSRGEIRIALVEVAVQRTDGTWSVVSAGFAR